MSKVIRWVLTGGLLYFVYQETGPATTLAVFMISLMTEIVGEWMQIVNRQIRLLAEACHANLDLKGYAELKERGEI